MQFRFLPAIHSSPKRASRLCSLALAVLVLLTHAFAPADDPAERRLRRGLRAADQHAEEPTSRESLVGQSYVKALDAALKEAGRHHDLASQPFKVSVRPVKEGWSVWLVFLPETPGADLMISVDRDGRASSVGGF